jgi:hypothetical protein
MHFTGSGIFLVAGTPAKTPRGIIGRDLQILFRGMAFFCMVILMADLDILAAKRTNIATSPAMFHAGMYMALAIANIKIWRAIVHFSNSFFVILVLLKV